MRPRQSMMTITSITCWITPPYVLLVFTIYLSTYFAFRFSTQRPPLLRYSCLPSQNEIVLVRKKRDLFREFPKRKKILCNISKLHRRHSPSSVEKSTKLFWSSRQKKAFDTGYGHAHGQNWWTMEMRHVRHQLPGQDRPPTTRRVPSLAQDCTLSMQPLQLEC